MIEKIEKNINLFYNSENGFMLEEILNMVESSAGSSLQEKLINMYKSDYFKKEENDQGQHYIIFIKN